MNYISAVEFLKQPKDIQDIFLYWWQPKMCDLIFRNFGNNSNSFPNGIYKSCILDNETFSNAVKSKNVYPLFTEGQLRQFIEDKTKGKFYIMLNSLRDGYVIVIDKVKNCKLEEVYNEEIFETDLLKVYWKIACDIALRLS